MKKWILMLVALLSMGACLASDANVLDSNAGTYYGVKEVGASDANVLASLGAVDANAVSAWGEVEEFLVGSGVMLPWWAVCIGLSLILFMVMVRTSSSSYIVKKYKNLTRGRILGGNAKEVCEDLYGVIGELIDNYEVDSSDLDMFAQALVAIKDKNNWCAIRAFRTAFDKGDIEGLRKTVKTISQCGISIEIWELNGIPLIDYVRKQSKDNNFLEIMRDEGLLDEDFEIVGGKGQRSVKVKFFDKLGK